MSGLHLDTHGEAFALAVDDLERAVAFYCDVLGFVRLSSGSEPGWVFLGRGESSSALVLHRRELQRGEDGLPADCQGLASLALRADSRKTLARAYRQLVASGAAGLIATERWITQSLSFKDPDDNPVEIYWEHPPTAWFQVEGRSPTQITPFDPASLLAELDE